MQYTPRRLRLEIQNKRKNKRGMAGRICLVVLVVLVFCFVARQLQNLLMMVTAERITAEKGTLELAFPAKVVLARYEEVYTSPLAGELEIIAKEEERIPEGGLLAIVRGEGASATVERPVKKIYARKAGIVSYKLDGLENILTPATISQLRKERIFEAARSASSQVVASQEVVSAGTGFVKIVNNLKPVTMYFTLPKEAFIKPPQGGDILTYRLKGQEKYLEATILEIIEGEEEYNIIAEAFDWPQDFLSKRLVDLEFITATFSGIVIPQSFLREQEGVKGVYVVTARGYKFKPVKQLGQVGSLVAVEGLGEGEEILGQTLAGR